MSAAQKLPLQIKGYTISGELGRGAFGVVYSAEKDGKEFAIKVMQSDAPEMSLDDVIRFREEAAAMARISHNGFVKVYEVFEEDGVQCMVMDRLKGETLEDKIQKATFDEEMAKKLILNIGGALAEIHRLNYLHCDIKPENIFMTPEGAKLIDLGMVRKKSQIQDVESTFRGTFLYASPEQIGALRSPIDHRSDLYSFGATIFEACSGRPPFVSEKFEEIIEKQSHEIPPRLDEIIPGFSPIIASIVSKLLEKDPASRYQSAQGLLGDINQWATLASSLESGEDLVLGRFDRASDSKESPMVGRELELQQLQRQFDDVLDGSAQTAIIEGEGGSGKSRLARELMSYGRDKGAMVLRAECSSVDTMSLSSIRELFNGYFHYLSFLPAGEKKALIDELKNNLGDSIYSLGYLSRSLAELFSLDEKVCSERYTSQELFRAGILEVTSYLISKNKVIMLCIDDVQWIDENSMSLLGYLRFHLSNQRFMMLFTSRDDETNLEALENFKTGLELDVTSVYKLGPLNPIHVEKLIAHCLGGADVSESLVKKISSAANMNPFAIIEYSNVILNSGALILEDQKWSIDPSKLDQVNLSNDLFHIIGERLKKLNHDVLEVLKLGALSGKFIDPYLLGMALEISQDQIEELLQVACNESFLEIYRNGIYSFSHDRVREACLTCISEKEKHKGHALLAKTLDNLTVKTDQQKSLMAFHYLHAGEDSFNSRAFEACIEAGELSLASFSYQKASEFLEFAVSLSEKLDLATDHKYLANKLHGIACFNTTDFVSASTKFDWCLQRADSKVEKSYLIFYKMRIAMSQGKWPLAWELFLQSIELIDSRFPRKKLSFVFGLILQFSSVVLKFLIPSKVLLRFRKKDAEGMNVQVLRTQIYDTALRVSYNNNNILNTLYVIFSGFNRAYWLGESPELGRAMILLTTVFANFQMKSLSKKMLSRVDKMAANINDPTLAAFVAFYRVSIYSFLGEIKEYEKAVPKAMEASEKYLSSSFQSALYLPILALMSHRGYSQDLVDYYFRNFEKIDATNDFQAMAHVRYSVSSHLIILGRFEEADSLRPLARGYLSETPDSINAKLMRSFSRLVIEFDKGNIFAKGFEKIIEETFCKNLNGFYWKVAYGWLMYIRLQQFELCKDNQEKIHYLVLLEKAVKKLNREAAIPTHRCHYFVGKAALSRLASDYSLARAHLDKAFALAKEGDSVFGKYWCQIERARLARAQKFEDQAVAEARSALQIAQTQNWKARAKAVAVEFGIETEKKEDKELVKKSKRLFGRTDVNVDMNVQKAIDLLLKVSEATSEEMNPLAKASMSLNTVLEIMGAEKAYIFTAERGKLKFYSGRNNEGEDVTEPQGHSSTIIEKVYNTKEPIIFTGNDAGETIGSKSIVLHNLKSIVVTPMIFGGDILGVLYVDSSVEKGLFNESDLELLKAVATQIAIGIKNARLAAAEVYHKEMEKDLELTAAVQRMFLPNQNHGQFNGLDVSALYLPASHCSGDWYWYRMTEDGRLQGAIADVTGHGAGPAMITAAVATCFSFQSLENQEIPLPDLIKKAHDIVFNLAKGEYAVSLLGFEISADRKKMKHWSAGHPKGISMFGDDEFDYFGERGSLLGLKESVSIGGGEKDLRDGERLFICSDGVPETQLPNGRILGNRRMLKILKQNEALQGPQFLKKLIEHVETVRGDESQQDDITCLVIDINRKGEAA